jgi:hypothetical protein
MKLPEFEYSDLPEEMKEKVSQEDFEIEPLTPQGENYTPKEVTPGKDAYMNRKIIRTLDEYAALQKVYQDKKTSKKEKWKQIKKVARYHKSFLYAVKDIDRDPTTYYNTHSPEGEILNDSEE